MNLLRKASEKTEQTLGERIAAVRKTKGYTQEEFSQLLGVTAQAVSKWENDLSCPDIMLLPKISELLDISVDELLSGKKSNLSGQNVTHDTAEKLRLRIRITAKDKKPIDISLPIALVKGLAKAGNSISAIIGSGAIEDIKLDEIIELVANGATGEILNIVTDDETNIIIEIS